MSHAELHLARAWRLTRGAGWGWRYGAMVIAALVCLPIASLVWIAAQGSPDLWPHLLEHVLPRTVTVTVVMLLGVGVLVAAIGTVSAWLVTAYDFPGRGVLAWALLLPLAVPTYIVAYAYLDILHPVGTVQDAIRWLLGYSSPREFRLPDVRSLPGCILLLGFVLYPYVYLTARAMFLTQAASLIEVARTLGASRAGVFWRVALPLARPAIALGVSLALMEALNDIGASEFLGVQTMTVSVYTSWISRADLPGAAQIALIMLVLVVVLIVVERYARRNQRYAIAAQRSRLLPPVRLHGREAALAFTLCGLPVLFGFIVPASYLTLEAIKRYRFASISPQIVRETLNTVTVSALATLVVLACGLTIAYAARLREQKSSRFVARAATLGYATPGTVLALGLLAPVGLADHWIGNALKDWFNVTAGLVILGSGGALIYAYAARFMAIAAGGIEAGFNRISPSLDQAARTLGTTASGVFRRVHLPLAKPAIAAAGLLVFVDCMKELPATLLLRPLNFETLATHLYGEAARGTYEEASIAALIIVVIGILPVILLARVGERARRGN
jgi:iron(III) transport system permease protein